MSTFELVESCDYCELKGTFSEATKNRRGYRLCDECDARQRAAEITCDEIAEAYFRDRTIKRN